MSAFFISEVSSNHHRDLDRCLDFIDASARIGADAVKFQLFRVDEMFAPQVLAQSADHRARAGWELPESFLPDLAARAHEHDIAFACTPFYLKAVEALEPHVDFFKIASYELLWEDLLIETACTGKPLVISTGMASQEEVVRARDTVFEAGAEDVTFLHCVSSYPTRVAEANLAAIETLRIITGCPVGWSDHSVDPGIVYRAVSRWGAAAVEFHLDLDGQGAEFSAGHCWLPEEIEAVIQALKQGLPIESDPRADGNGRKAPTPREETERAWRADPVDGLRPMKEIRISWRPAA